MPGGPELIIIAVLAIPIAIVLLIMALSGSRTAVPNSGDTIALSGDARTWLELIAIDIHQLNGHHIEWLSADVIQVSWRHRSGWVFIVAIILFPFGLLALLFTVTSYGTIVLVHDGSPSTIRLGGEMSNAAIDAINVRAAGAVPTNVGPQQPATDSGPSPASRDDERWNTSTRPLARRCSC